MNANKRRLLGIAAIVAIPLGLAFLVSERTVTQAADTPSTSDVLPPKPFCLEGVSKDLCQGKLVGGQWTLTQCAQPGQPTCVTLVGKGAILTVSVRKNPGQCSPEALCDETVDLDGTLRALLDFRLRRDNPCAVRGSWGGTTQVIGSPGLPVIQGQLRGTVGVGSHRMAFCDTAAPCGRDCETCYEAFFEPAIGRWRIHVEAHLRGRIVNGIHKGCMVSVSLQGYFTAPGDPLGPIPPTAGASPWEFCGTADGVLECPCANTTPLPVDALAADLDMDGDADLEDFSLFQACFNGPNRPPACE